jgi:excisionase family DNA binding protein
VSRPADKRRDVPADALAYSVDDGAERLGVGATTFEDLIASGQIKTFKVGRRRLVSRQALEKFIARQERAA